MPQLYAGMDEHGIAHRRRCHVVADRVHPAGVLVPENDRQGQARGLHEPVLGVQVGRADPAPTTSTTTLLGTRRLGLRPLHELQRAVVLAEQRRPHAATPTLAPFAPG